MSKMIDTKFAKILTPSKSYIFKEDSRYLIPFIYGSKIGFANKNEEIVIKPQFDIVLDDFTNKESLVRVGEFYIKKYEGSSSTYLYKRYGLLNSLGEFILPMEYDGISMPINSSPYTIRSIEKGYCVIDKNGNTVIPFGKYHYIDGFDCGISRVAIKTQEDTDHKFKWGLIDESGFEIFKPEYDSIPKFYNLNRLYLAYSINDKKYKICMRDFFKIIRNASEKEREIELAYLELNAIWEEEDTIAECDGDWEYVDFWDIEFDEP